MPAPTPEERDRSMARFSAFADSFRQESDRGAALVAAAVLDERLGEILSGFLVDCEESRELVDGYNAPLGTFAARASAALALALIEPSEFRNISLIRKIRNKFGHAWEQLSFQDAEINDVCRELTYRAPIPELYARERFNEAVLGLLGDLNPRPRLAREERRTPKEWPNKAIHGRVIAGLSPTEFTVEFFDPK